MADLIRADTPGISRVQGLAEHAATILSLAHADSTRKSYKSAFHGYESYCDTIGARALPPTFGKLLGFASNELLGRGLKANTCDKYLTGVLGFCTTAGIDTAAFGHPSVLAFRRGMRQLAKGEGTKKRLPLTLELLKCISKRHLAYTNPADVTLAAVLALGTHGLFRAGEIVRKPGCPTLERRDISFESNHIAVRLKSTKTSRNVPVTVRVPATGTIICPELLLRAAMAHAPDRRPEAPVFQDAQGNGLTYLYFATALARLLATEGLDPSQYGTHSMRAGGATSLAIAGVPAYAIKALGRWKSVTYQLYVRPGDTAPQDQVRRAMRAAGQTTHKEVESTFGGLTPSAISTASLDDIIKKFSTCG